MPSATINVMEAAARKAARGLIRDFGEVENLQVSRKGPADFVTQADRRAERILRAELTKARPGFGFLMEESGETEGEDTRRRWIVDPLDGTANFVHGFPHVAVSIGVRHRGRMKHGVVFDPLRQELFTASRGSGARINERRLRVATKSSLKGALLGGGFVTREIDRLESHLAALRVLMSGSAQVRRSGSAALDLAYVAAGRLDGFWELGLEPWDLAAGVLLVQEAGGIVTEPGGGDDYLRSGDVAAANPKMLRAMLRAMGPGLSSPAGTSAARPR
jgi:myo-inositol-1(or 4)-monophosphatase